MDAVDFIKKYTIDKARELFEGAPEHCFVYDLERKEYVAYEDTSIAMCFLKSRFIDLSELKRLVESVDLVNSHGCLEMVRGKLNEGEVLWRDIPRLRQAIADYESIYGGEHV